MVEGGNGEAYFWLQGENGGTINEHFIMIMYGVGLEGQFAYFVGYFEHQ